MASLILFGAGASHGSDSSGTPPLGSDLFSGLRAFNPDGWGALSPSMAAAFNKDFERGMAMVAQQNPHVMPVLQRAMAAYFYTFVPRNRNTYFDLARRLKNAAWNGALTTLNYERLLEVSLINAGLQPVVGSGTARQQIELCFPHGCCHIFCDSVRMSAAAVSFSGTGITTDGPVSVVSDPAAHRQRIMTDAVPPVMSYFQPDKRTTAGASFIANQRARWAELAAHAKTIAIVGVRVRPHDAHIWAPLASSKARVTYCAGKGAAKEFSEWATSVRRGKRDVVLTGYFADELEALCTSVGL